MKILVAALLFVSCCQINAGAIEGNDIAKEGHESHEVHDETTVPNPVDVESKVALPDNRQRLIDSIFRGYDKRNYPTNGSLEFGISLNRFDVDEERSTADADVWLRCVWQDPRLKWNPDEFGGESVLRFPAAEVWRPDISLYNTAEPLENMRCRDTNVLVYPTGKVLWVPPCQLKANCNLTLDTHPYGDQTCTFKFGSWTFDGFLQDLQFYKHEEKADMSYFSDLSEWVITGNTAERESKYYSCCTEPYVTLDFKVKFHRKGIESTRGNNVQAKL